MNSKRKPYKVVALQFAPNAGKFAVQSAYSRFGVHDTVEAAQEQAERLNEACDL